MKLKSFWKSYPYITNRCLCFKKKLDNVEASGADILVTDCPGCVMQLKGGLDKRQSPVKVLHLVELLAKKK
ncbi:MAG: (Fe-S)-binding protein [Desulfobacula sp.]|nr:(Fe-S)-binding protein [Desulfobacula sp.]